MMLVDDPTWEARGRVWSHLASDTSYAELHDFAERVGLHPFAYDGDHYDVPSEKYERVVAAGAVPSSSRQVLAAVRAAGLRFPKRRGEKPVAAIWNGMPHVSEAHRLDLVLSDHEPGAATTVAVRVFAVDGEGRWATVRDGAGLDVPGVELTAGEPARSAAARAMTDVVGTSIDPTAFDAVAYARITMGDQAAHACSGPGAARHVAMYRLDLPGDVGRRPGRAPGRGGDARWVEVADIDRRCGDQPWWPLFDRLVRADGSQTRRAVSVR